jgi:hypothetical protein
MTRARYQLVNAVLLSVDSAAVSGFEIASPVYNERDQVIDYESIRLGTITSQEDIRDVVENAAEEAQEFEIPLLVIAEDWTPHGISTKTFGALNRRWGRWEAELEHAGVPEDHIIRVLPNPWRNDLFGRRRPKTRAALKKHAQMYAESILKLPRMQHDIAEAVCLRYWGCRTEVAHKIVKEAA